MNPAPPVEQAPTAIIEQMQALEQTISGCQKCALANGRTHAVPGYGNLDTVVMLVGEGPGFEEDKQGRPFVGRSGQFLTEMLHSVGIRRENVYITNVVKCRPPNNRDPLPDELAACSDYLTHQIALINPRIIVTLGRFSMARWFPGAAITKVHGQVRNIGRGRVALAMFHPAAALRNPQWAIEFKKDLQRLPKLVERAVKANAAALRGEALPAGVPHPGDPDHQPVIAVPPATPPAAASASSASPLEKPDANQLTLF